MAGYALQESEPLTLGRRGRLAGMYVLSPFVWADGDRFHLLLRAVPRRDDEPRLKMAEIWYGMSADGLHFEMDEGPVIFPGPDIADLDGCEDPTVWYADGTHYVWYTGWNHAEQTGRLLLASGASPSALAKDGMAIDSTAEFANPKEATVLRTAAGEWRMFFEYARDEASCIGIAESADPRGPWTCGELMLEPRGDAWDSWHLSTGPVVAADSGRPVMFYNGASRDAHWRIGWVAFDADCTRVVDRGELPLITPELGLDKGMTDIAFASSAVERDGELWLYHSIADQTPAARPHPSHVTEAYHYDVIVIGTGPGGAALAQRLAATGKHILILERGKYLPRAEANWDAKSVFVDGLYQADETWIDAQGRAFSPALHYNVGGNSKVYGAALLRMRERDFGELEHAAGVSPAWPIGYDAFEPYYAAAEELFHVHGARGEDPHRTAIKRAVSESAGQP